MNITEEMQQETLEIITDLFNDGSDPEALYIIEHHISHTNFDKLEKIAVEAFKKGYEVSEAEEFDEENGTLLFCFDIISEAKLTPEVIQLQQKDLLPLIESFGGNYDGWGTYFEDPNGEDDAFGEDAEFFDE